VAVDWIQSPSQQRWLEIPRHRQGFGDRSTPSGLRHSISPSASQKPGQEAPEEVEAKFESLQIRSRSEASLQRHTVGSPAGIHQISGKTCLRYWFDR